MSTTATLTHDEELFLELLSCALHSELPRPELFAGLEERSWRRIHRLATSHAVPAFVGDRILTLPKGSLPNRNLCLTIFSEIELTRRANAYLTGALGKLSKLYEEAGLPFILLKGLSLSQYYPDPSLRSGGDLDVLFSSGDHYEKANHLLRPSPTAVRSSRIMPEPSSSAISDTIEPSTSSSVRLQSQGASSPYPSETTP